MSIALYYGKIPFSMFDSIVFLWKFWYWVFFRNIYLTVQVRNYVPDWNAYGQSDDAVEFSTNVAQILRRSKVQSGRNTLLCSYKIISSLGSTARVVGDMPYFHCKNVANKNFAIYFKGALAKETCGRGVPQISNLKFKSIWRMLYTKITSPFKTDLVTDVN